MAGDTRVVTELDFDGQPFGAVDVEEEGGADEGLEIEIGGEDEGSAARAKETDGGQPVVQQQERDGGRQVQAAAADEDLSDEEGELAAEHEAEVAKYSDSVKKRISKLTAAKHKVRRQAEFLAQRDNAWGQHTQQLSSEKKSLKETLKNGEQVLGAVMKELYEMKVAGARAAYKAASEAGDTDAASKAVSDMTLFGAELSKVQTFQPTNWDQLYPERGTLKPIAAAAQPQQQQRQQAPQAADTAWHAKNPWFGTDQEMTATSYVVDAQVRRQGIDPLKDAAAYYSAIDAGMKRAMPDKFKGQAQQKPTAAGAAMPVVRSVGGDGGRRKVTLTREEVKVAKDMGISLADYAREKEKGGY